MDILRPGIRPETGNVPAYAIFKLGLCRCGKSTSPDKRVKTIPKK